MLSAHNLTKTYKGTTILENIDLEVPDGEFVILTGRSGSGKTTLLSILGGLTSPDSGTVVLDDEDIFKMGEKDLASLRNRKMGFVFQFPSLVPTLKTLDNVLLPIAFSGRTPDIDDLDRAKELLEMVGMGEHMNHYPSQLSGGQQRRAVLARSLINKPKILLADEPTGDLDEKSEAVIMELFARFNEQGVTVFINTHALDYISLGKQVITLKEGRIVPYEAQEVASGLGASGWASYK